MPVYSARLLIHKNKRPSEEIWFENIRASSQNKAQRIVNERAARYVRTQSGEEEGAYGYQVLLCARTVIVDGLAKGASNPPADVKVLGAKEQKMLPIIPHKDTTAKHKPAKVKMNIKVFTDEMKGEFSDAMSFKPELCQREFLGGFGFTRGI